ncbi:SDR family NAD(P)-dependent oxidoreductase [Acuticoccus sp. I52.16.1]|uniref:SDR family NAD(P)-dependent oxidoreductase n=1 Tax=Acuticoccus sp. I52.16.1 TaxID=2928472 RepID=UPI001FD55D2A|nr:SDR family NAD(P)-dependent oxidoreductase [Acuticoccus sp. I52.16.1]UOM35399.1 SDR family oxidoreductase [Acuticoccus sp. I52.16.1]
MKTILVTGGPSGIGRAVTEAVLAEGWRAIAVDVSEATLATCAEELAFAGDRLVCAPLDVADEAAVTAFVDRMEGEGYAIDGVVNCAGIAADIPAFETSVDLFRKILDVNVVGSFVVARAAAKVMAARGEGAIVNIASISGMVGSSGRVAYGASKGAVITATKVLAIEWAEHGIRVNAISPGPIETPMVAAVHTAASRQAFYDRVPARRYGTPEEVAAMALVLLDGARSGYVTGQNIAVDGGMTAAGIMHGTKRRTA